MNVLIVDDDKLARKGLIAVIDWEQYGLCVVGDSFCLVFNGVFHRLFI